MTYSDWIEYAVSEYELVSKNYNHKVYENVVVNPESHKRELMQLTLREVLAICDHTNYEERIRRAVMKCVYTNEKLEPEIRKVMDPFFEAS